MQEHVEGLGRNKDRWAAVRQSRRALGYTVADTSDHVSPQLDALLGGSSSDKHFGGEPCSCSHILAWRSGLQGAASAGGPAAILSIRERRTVLPRRVSPPVGSAFKVSQQNCGCPDSDLRLRASLSDNFAHII